MTPESQNTHAEWDDSWDMCPNCNTPWKCNGPHLWEETEAFKRFGPLDEGNHWEEIVVGLKEQVANLQRHNDKLHRRLKEHLPSDYGSVKGEARKAWEKAKAYERGMRDRDVTIARLEAKIERMSALLTEMGHPK